MRQEQREALADIVALLVFIAAMLYAANVFIT